MKHFNNDFIKLDISNLEDEQLHFYNFSYFNIAEFIFNSQLTPDKD